MKIFVPALVISEKDGFTAENDIFGRAELGSGLCYLLETVSEPMVLSLDGPWGSGKTTFFKMWAGELRKRGFPVVYIDAFQHDYSDDAFSAVAGEIVAIADKKQSTKLKTFREKTLAAGKVVLRGGMKIGVRAATLGALDAADLEAARADIAKEVSELTDKYLGDMLTKQKEKKQAIAAFQEALAELPAMLSADKDAPLKPLIVIIDELDRCRPVFALEILERIKHFFSVENVHFVLGAHLGQLRNSVRVAYGADVDAQLYLQKFIHLTFSLGDDTGRASEWVSAKYLKYVANQLEFRPEHKDIVDGILGVIGHVVHPNALSLRTIERIMTTVALSLTFLPPRRNFPTQILAGLCVLKVTAPVQFVQAKTGNLHFRDVERALGLHTPPPEPESYDFRMSRAMWRWCLEEPWSNSEEEKRYQDFVQFLRREPRELLTWVANKVVDRLQPVDS